MPRESSGTNHGPDRFVSKGRTLGYITSPRGDNFHLYGRWKPENHPLIDEFHATVEHAMERWEEDIAGVDVYLDPESTRVVEVTGFQNGEIEILVNPGRWPFHK